MLSRFLYFQNLKESPCCLSLCISDTTNDIVRLNFLNEAGAILLILAYVEGKSMTDNKGETHVCTGLNSIDQHSYISAWYGNEL